MTLQAQKLCTSEHNILTETFWELWAMQQQVWTCTEQLCTNTLTRWRNWNLCPWKIFWRGLWPFHWRETPEPAAARICLLQAQHEGWTVSESLAQSSAERAPGVRNEITLQQFKLKYKHTKGREWDSFKKTPCKSLWRTPCVPVKDEEYSSRGAAGFTSSLTRQVAQIVLLLPRASCDVKTFPLPRKPLRVPCTQPQCPLEQHQLCPHEWGSAAAARAVWVLVKGTRRGFL